MTRTPAPASPDAFEGAASSVDELADAHMFLDEKDVPRFDQKTGDRLPLRQRIEQYALKVTGDHLLEILKRSTLGGGVIPTIHFARIVNA